MAIYEEQLERWARGPAATEASQCDNTITRLTNVIRPVYGNRVSIFPQGSYKNRTNVRQDSDVDVVVRDDHTYFSDLQRMTAEDQERYWRNLGRADHTYEEFKERICNVLTDAFGSSRVERRNKCILVKETSTGVNADVVPCFVLKRLLSDGVHVEAEGIQFNSDQGPAINSFPVQHYDNGVAKNNRTERMFKRTVRILKNVRGALIDQALLDEQGMSSFFIECLVYNAPDAAFDETTYRQATRNVIQQLWSGTSNGADQRYVEINGLKWLFRDGKTVAQARTFLQSAWNLIGYS